MHKYFMIVLKIWKLQGFILQTMQAWLDGKKFVANITVTKYAIYLIILSTLTKTDDFGTSAILATTWQGGHVGGQNNIIFFQRIIYMKLGLSSQRREMFLFLTTKHTNDQMLQVCGHYS